MPAGTTQLFSDEKPRGKKNSPSSRRLNRRNPSSAPAAAKTVHPPTAKYPAIVLARDSSDVNCAGRHPEFAANTLPQTLASKPNPKLPESACAFEDQLDPAARNTFGQSDLSKDPVQQGKQPRHPYKNPPGNFGSQALFPKPPNPWFESSRRTLHFGSLS
jgi:hypothetical protein